MRSMDISAEDVSKGAPGPVIAVAYPATAEEMRQISCAVGPDCAVVDVRHAPRRSRLVLCRPCSHQAVSRLHGDFPDSVVVFVHEHPWADEARTGLIDDADRHLVAADASALGRQLRAAIHQGIRPAA